MSKPANKKVIGGFVLGATALLVVALVIFGSGKIFTKTLPVVFYFEGSVKGLDVGSPVVIRGVKVGSVTDVELQFDPKELSVRIPVFAEFDPDKVVRIGGKKYTPQERPAAFKNLIDHGLRAQLQMQSIVTGQLMINLDFLPNTPVRLVGTDPHKMEIPTVPTSMEELAKRLEELPIEEIFDKLAKALEGVEKVVNSPEVQEGMKNLSQGVDEVKKLVKSVNDEIKPLTASIKDTLQDTRSLVNRADTQIQGVTARVDGVMQDTQKLIQNVDRQVEPLASRVESTLEATRKLVADANGEVGPMASDLKKTLEEIRAAVVQSQKMLQAAQANYAEGSALYYELTETLAGLNEASQSIQLLGEYLKRHPDSVLWGKGKPGGR